MLSIKSVNHIGIRVSDKLLSTSFYEKLGFKLIVDHGFDQGHPIVMQHNCGVTLNILGLATEMNDIKSKYSR